MVNPFDRLEAFSIPEVQEIFLETFGGITDRAIIKEMIAAIEANDIERLMRASGYSEAALNEFVARVEEVFNQSGKVTVSQWPKQVTTVFGVFQPVFNIRNPVVSEQLSNYSSNLVSNITKEVRDSLRLVLNEGYRTGENPRTTALNIVGTINPSTRKREGGVIGLSSNQTNWSISVKRYLETKDNKYFQMKLRDKRFDKTVQKYFSEGKDLNKETVSKLVSAYNNRALKFRGDLVARTETLSAINRAEHAAHLQGINEGLFSRSQVTKEWDDVGGARTRHTHLDLGRRYGRGKGIDLEQPFVTSTGQRLMFPTDTSLGAGVEEIANCRCKGRYRVDWLAVNE